MKVPHLPLLSLIILIWWGWGVERCLIVCHTVLWLHFNRFLCKFCIPIFPPYFPFNFLIGFSGVFSSHRMSICTLPRLHLSDNFVCDLLHQIKVFFFFLGIQLNPLIFPFMVCSFKRFLTYQSQVYCIFLPYFLLLASWFYLSHLPFKPNWSYFRRWYKRRTQRLKNRHVVSPFSHHYLLKNSPFLCGADAPSNTH